MASDHLLEAVVIVAAYVVSADKRGDLRPQRDSQAPGTPPVWPGREYGYPVFPSLGIIADVHALTAGIEGPKPLVHLDFHKALNADECV